MQSFIGLDSSNLIVIYSYPAIILVIALESIGMPLPGETVLITAAIYAGATHQLSIVLFVLAATFGAVLGDNAGFWIGRRLGFPILWRYGRFVGFDERRLKLGRYLFSRHAGKVVFFGRFTTSLRALAALLAAANDIAWPRFLLFNMADGVLWATLYGGGGWALGSTIQRIAGPIGIGLAVLAVASMLAGAMFLRRHEGQLTAEAEPVLPGRLAPPARTGTH